MKQKPVKIQIWQLDRNVAAEKMFVDYDTVRDKFGGVDFTQYRKVYEGTVYTNNLDGIYMTFNVRVPEDYKGRSSSVSDIIVIMGKKKKYRYFYVDSFGFRKLTWDENSPVNRLKMREV